MSTKRIVDAPGGQSGPPNSEPDLFGPVNVGRISEIIVDQIRLLI